MDHRKLTMIISFLALGLLVISFPVGWWVSRSAGITVRWIGVGVALIYFYLRSKLIQES